MAYNEDLYYILALPGAGKSILVRALRSCGIYAVDGDHLTDLCPPVDKTTKIYKETVFRLIEQLAPNYVVWSRWPNDLDFPLGSIKALILVVPKKKTLRKTWDTTRLDLSERFDKTTFDKWYEDTAFVLNATQKIAHRVVRIDLEEDQFVTDVVDKIFDVTGQDSKIVSQVLAIRDTIFKEGTENE